LPLHSTSRCGRRRINWIWRSRGALSCVLAKAQKGNLWVTLQAHPNIVAVATLLELAGVVVTEGRELDPSTVKKANEKGLPIFTTSHATFTIVGELAKLGVAGVD